jgi:hypothetical protein
MHRFLSIFSPRLFLHALMKLETAVRQKSSKFLCEQSQVICEVDILLDFFLGIKYLASPSVDLVELCQVIDINKILLDFFLYIYNSLDLALDLPGRTFEQSRLSTLQ